LVAAITTIVWTNRGGSLKLWVGKVGWSSLVEMVYAVWFNLVLKDSGLGWVGVLEYILLKWCGLVMVQLPDHLQIESQPSYVFPANGVFVSSKSSKQEIVPDCTTEAEYIVASKAVKESVWIRKFLIELGLYCDNNGAIAQAK